MVKVSIANVNIKVEVISEIVQNDYKICRKDQINEKDLREKREMIKTNKEKKKE